MQGAQCKYDIRYVGVFGLFFMSSTFYRLDVHNKTHVALASICKNRIENETSFDLVMLIGSACLLILEVDT